MSRPVRPGRARQAVWGWRWHGSVGVWGEGPRPSLQSTEASLVLHGVQVYVGERGFHSHVFIHLL